MHTPTSPTCPQCGTAIPDDAAGRLCPRCVFAKALAPTADGTFVPHRPPDLDEVRAAFPHLEIIGLIGSGGMGAVFKARQPQLDRFVALKILPAELAGQRGFSERFQREAQALARLNHPNIVSVHDFGQAGGFYYLLMEFVDGVNLRQLLQAKRLTPKEALSIVPPVCEALQCAHDHGIVHRDIKPENLLIDKNSVVKIADFGIAKIVASDSARGSGYEVPREDSQTTALGTPDYAAPEQADGSADHRADIYSLGVVLYEMLTGERPTEKLEAPSKRVQVDIRIDEIVLRALEKAPELRFATAADFRTQVEAATRASMSPVTTDLSRFSRDPANWRWFFIYFCREDPRVIVPKRVGGLGWTLNFARPAAVPLLAGLCAVVWAVFEILQQSHASTQTIWTTSLVLLMGLVVFCHKLSNPVPRSVGGGWFDLPNATNPLLRHLALPAAAFVLTYLALVLYVNFTGPQLPERVATHFGAHGAANGWMTRHGHITFTTLMPLGLLVFLALVFCLITLNPQSLNIPHRDYWMAPERRRATFCIFAGQNLILSAIVTLFLASIHWSILTANLATPPKLSGGTLSAPVAGFIGLLMLWGIGLTSRFSTKSEAERVEDGKAEVCTRIEDLRLTSNQMPSGRAAPPSKQWIWPVIAVVLLCTGGIMMGIGIYASQNWDWDADNGAMIAGMLLPFIAGIISGWRLFREPRYGALGPVPRIIFAAMASHGLVTLFRSFQVLWLWIAKKELDQSSLVNSLALQGAFSQVAVALEIGAAFGLYAWTQRRMQAAVTKAVVWMTVVCWVLLAVHSMVPWFMVAFAKLAAPQATSANASITKSNEPKNGQTVPHDRLIKHEITVQTLDARLQRIAEQAMRDAGVLQGAFAAIDPDSGEVVALVALPSSTTDAGGVGRWAVTQQPARELFQPVTALAGLMIGRGGDVYACNPIASNARVGGVRYWSETKACDTSTLDKAPHGQLTLEEALRKSCFSYFYQYGNATGFPQILSMANTLGLQRETDVFGSKSIPVLPDLSTFQNRFSSERQATLQTAEIASGRVTSMSPLQMAAVYSAIANGKVWEPALVKNDAAAPRADFSRVSVMKAGLQQVRQALKHVVNDPDGRARSAVSSQVVFAGMAAALGGVSKEPDSRSITDRSWFAGFAPFDHPRLAFALFVEKRTPGSVEGIDGSGPIIRQIVEEALSVREVAPDEPRAAQTVPVTDGTKPASTIETEAITTLDPRLEQIAIRAMLDANVATGAFAAVDPESGRVLALVSLVPSFLEKYEAAKRSGPDPILPRKSGIRSAFVQQPLFEIFQPVTALSAVLSGRANDKYTCVQSFQMDGAEIGAVKLGTSRFPCKASVATKAACGELDLTQALMRGCTSYFYYALAVTGYPKLQVTAEQLGLQNETNILGGKAYPVLPPEPTRDPDSRLDGSPLQKKVMVASGQLCQGSPLQIAGVYSALANGKVWQPLTDRGSIPVLKMDYDEKSHAGLEVIREALKRMVNDPDGRAHAAHSSKQIIAGSTATIVLNPRGGSKDRDLTKNIRYDWFAGFAPFDNPKLAFALFVEERGAPDGLKFAGCGPVIRRIVEEALWEGEVTPNGSRAGQTVPTTPSTPASTALKKANTAESATATEIPGGLPATIADGFDYPVGGPNLEGYRMKRGAFDHILHPAEDYVPSNSDLTGLGDPIRSAADGLVVFSEDTKGGFGNVIIIRHRYRRQDGSMQLTETVYTPLQTRSANVGEAVKRGQQIGTLGDNNGMYPPHLHFEIRKTLNMGIYDIKNFEPNATNYWSPGEFIQGRRPNQTSGTQEASLTAFQLRWVRETPSAETEPMPLAGRGQKQTLNVEKTVLLDQSALLSVEAAHKSGSSKIALQLTESGRQRFAAVTREGKGRRLAVVIDGQIRAAPLIMAEISDGRMEISGNLTHEEADDLAVRLQTALEKPDDQLKPSGKDGPRKNPPASATSPASTAPSGEDHVFDETRHHALRVASKDAVPHFQFAAGKTFLIRTPSAASKDEVKADWDKANAEGGVDFSLSEEAGDILIHPRGCLFGKWVDGLAAYTSTASQTMSMSAMLSASTEPIRLGKGQWPVTCLVRTSQGMIGWMTVSSVNEVENKADRLSFEYRLVKKLGGAPQTVSEFYQKANQRWGQGDYKGVVAVYDEAIKQHAAESGFFNNRANAHAALANYDKALADYAEALRLAPGHSNIHRARSLACLQMGDYDRAIADLDIAVKADPQGVNFDLRGRAYHAKGDFRAALADYEKGAQVTPGYTFTFVDLAWLLATCPDQEIRDGQKASQYARLAAAALQTSHAEVLVAQAAARAEERDYAEAIQLEQSFLKTLPTDSAEAAGSRERLKLYQAHQPLRSPMPIFRSLWR